jgi:hypothetical protein
MSQHKLCWPESRQNQQYIGQHTEKDRGGHEQKHHFAARTIDAQVFNIYGVRGVQWQNAYLACLRP